MGKIAIIETGGKQYVVSEGDVVTIEKLSGRPSSAKSTEGQNKITFDKVLLTDDGKETMVGAPYVEGATVSAELIEEGRGKKITVIRYRQKSRYMKTKGHRQPFSKVRITALS